MKMKKSDRKELELEFLSGRTNSVCFANMVSCNRHLLYASAEKHSVPLRNPEIPIVSTIHTQDCNRSSDNYTADTDMVVKEVIRKKVFGKDTSEAVVFYERLMPNGSVIVDVIIHKDRINTAVDAFSVGINNDMVNNETYIPKGKMYIRTSSYTESGMYRKGVNLRSIYLACETTLEDAIDIFPTGAKKLETTKLNCFTTRIDANTTIMKNLYGDSTRYQPIPLIGEVVKGDYLIALSSDSSDVSFLKFNETMNSRVRSDRAGIYPSGSKVINITARLPREFSTPNRFLMDLVNEQRAYEDTIFERLLAYRNYASANGFSISREFLELYLELNSIINENAKYRYKEDIVSEQSVILEIELEKISYVQHGQKLSGLHGNKGIVSKVRLHEEQAYDENGEPIDIIINQAGVINRSNPGQLYEKYLALLGADLARHMVNSYPVNMSNLLLDYMYKVNKNLGDRYKLMLESHSYDEVIEKLKEDKVLYYCLPAWSHKVTLATMLDLEDFLTENNVAWGNKRVRIGNVWLPDKYDVGHQYFVRLQQSVESKVNIRSKGELSSKGNVAKNFDKKAGLVKYQNTPIKISEYITDILQNSLNSEQSKRFMQNETSVIEALDALTRATGFQITLRDNPYLDGYMRTSENESIE